jgi:hypothetical protein
MHISIYFFMEYFDISVEYLIKKLAKISVIFIASYNTNIIAAPSFFLQKIPGNKNTVSAQHLIFLRAFRQIPGAVCKR